jgi:hypothetical protein
MVRRIEVPYSKFNFVLLRTPLVHYCSHRSLLFAPCSEPDEFTSLINTLFLQDPPPHIHPCLESGIWFHVFRIQMKFCASQAVLTHYCTVCIAARYSNFKLSGPINFTLTLHQMGSPLVLPLRLTTIPINSLSARRSVCDVTLGVNQDVWVDYVWCSR